MRSRGRVSLDDGTLAFRLAVITLLALIAWLMMIAVDQLAAQRLPIRFVHVRDIDDVVEQGE